MTKKEVKKLLDELEPELRASIEVAQSELKEARSLAKKLGDLVDRANELNGRLEDPTTGVDSKLAKATEDLSKISSAVTSSDELLVKIDESLVGIQKNIGLMTTAYAEFEVIKAKIDEPTTGLDAVFLEIKASRAKAQSAATRSETLQSDVEVAFTKIQGYISKMDVAYTDFVASKAKIDDPTTGLDAILDTSQALHDDISALSKTSQTLYTEIGKYKEEAARNIASIQTIKDDSDIALENIKQHEIDSEATKTRIADIYELVSQTGHANRFDTRAKKLRNSSWIWFTFGVIAIVSVVLIALFWIAPLLHTDDNTDIQMRVIALLILRTLIVTPIIAFTIFTFSQFGKDRRLSEQYAFKAVSAATLEGSISLILRSLKNIPDEKMAEFAINTASNLHTEPTELHSKSKFSLRANSKLVDVVAEVGDTLEDLNQNLDDIKNIASRPSNPGS